MASPAKKLTTRPKAFNHFWPRLWLTAKPLGYEARQCQKKGELPDCLFPLDNIDTRIFVRGGEWVSGHQDLIVSCNPARLGSENAGTNEARTRKSDVGSGAMSIYGGNSEGTSMGGQKTLMGTFDNGAGTCVLFSEGSPLYEAANSGRRPSCVQGVVVHVYSKSGTVELKVAKNSGTWGINVRSMTLELTNRDIWWCFPFWVAAGHLVHGGKVPVEAGFYFLAEPEQEFQVVTVNWADQDFLTENSVDGTKTSSDQWHLAARAMDKAPVVACLYETTASETSVEGARFMFKARLKVKEAHRNWEEELRTEAGVVCETIFAVKQAESETDTSDFSYEESSDEEGGSYPDYEEELSQKARRAHDRKKAAKRKLATRWKSRPARKKGKFSDRTSPQKASSADTSKKGHCGEATPVKQDSKWALHRSLAPARGALGSDNFLTIELEAGDKLGEKRAHYREASWFTNVDLLLQEEGLKAARNRSAIVSPDDVPGQSSAKPIELPDSDDDVEDPPAWTAAQANTLKAPKAEPASHVGTPSRRGKAPAAKPGGDVSTADKEGATLEVPEPVNTPSAGAKGPRRETHVSTPGGRPKLLKVKYHEQGTLGSPSYVVQVPRSESIYEVKTQARQALADPDVAGESVLTARLRWTFLDEDGSEVDISKHTTADDLDRSPAINVYVRA